MANVLLTVDEAVERFIKTARDIVKQEFPDLTDQVKIDELAMQVIIGATQGLRESPMKMGQ